MRPGLKHLGLAALPVALVLAMPASAAGRSKQPFYITLSPARVALVAGHGTTTRIVHVSNSGTALLRVTTSVVEFSQNESGEIALSAPGPASAANWVDAHPLHFTLEPGARQRVKVVIIVPPGAEPGERQVGVVFKVPPQQGSGNVAVSGSVASELLIEVPGHRVEKIAIGPLDVPWLADGGPIPVALTVRNLGNVHEDFIKQDQLEAIVSTGHRIDLPAFTDLAHSTRVVKADWNDPPFFCICHLTVATTAPSGHRITASARVIVFPIRLAIGVLVAALGLFLLLRGGARRRRSDTAQQVEQARREALEQARREFAGPPSSAVREKGPPPEP
jgi:hypothetical protein